MIKGCARHYYSYVGVYSDMCWMFVCVFLFYKKKSLEIDTLNKQNTQNNINEVTISVYLSIFGVCMYSYVYHSASTCSI